MRRAERRKTGERGAQRLHEWLASSPASLVAITKAKKTQTFLSLSSPDSPGPSRR